MEDYPRTLQEFEARFSTEEGREYSFSVAVAGGVSMSTLRGWQGVGGSCHLVPVFEPATVRTSVTAGTVFQDTRKPLSIWFRAMWFVTSQKNGASALGLQRVLGLGSYRTAWSWLHKLRRAMVRSGRDRLAGLKWTRPTWALPEEGVVGRGVRDAGGLIVTAAQACDRKRASAGFGCESSNTPPPPACFLSLKIASNPAVQCIPTAGKAMPD